MRTPTDYGHHLLLSFQPWRNLDKEAPLPLSQCDLAMLSAVHCNWIKSHQYHEQFWVTNRANQSAFSPR